MKKYRNPTSAYMSIGASKPGLDKTGHIQISSRAPGSKTREGYSGDLVAEGVIEVK